MFFVPHRTRRLSKRQIALTSVLPLLFAVGILAIWIHYRGAKKPVMVPKVVVNGIQARQGNIGVYLDAIGTVTPVYTASIASQAAGMIVAVHYQEGQFVSKGDLLVEIDAAPYRATLMQAQGALLRDRNLLAQARMDLDRYRAAWRRRAISRQQLDDQEKVAHQYEGTVQNDLGAVRYAEIQVQYCKIAAPISGRVGLRLVDPGNIVQATGSPVLAVVTQTMPITVVFTLPEGSLGAVQARLRLGNTLPVDVFDSSGRQRLASGALVAMDNQIDTMTGTVRGRAIFENEQGALFPNQFVNVRLLVESKEGVVLLPSSTVQQTGTASFVYVLENGIARERPVKRGVTENGETEIGGIAAGAWVADTGFDRLHEGAAVILSTAPVAGADGASGASSP